MARRISIESDTSYRRNARDSTVSTAKLRWSPGCASAGRSRDALKSIVPSNALVISLHERFAG